MQLRPYQVESVEWLRPKKTALLALEMRLGKSAVAIISAFHKAEFRKPTIGVVCPASVVPVWHEQFAKWWPGSAPPGILIASYEKVTRGEFDQEDFDTLIIDEAHYLKSADALRTKKIYGPKCDGVGGLIERATNVYALTGTPAPNHPAELWPTLRALAPETIPGPAGKPMSYWQFVSKYCKTRDNGFGLQIIGGKNLDKLKEAIAPFVLRRLFKDVVADAKEPVYDTLPVNGSAPDETELEKFIKPGMTDDEIVAAIRKHVTHVASTRRLTGLAKVKGVTDWFRTWVDGGGGKVVFMAHHRDVIHALKTGMRGVVGQGGVSSSGESTSAHERAMAVKNFREKDDCVAYVGQIQRDGTGIDLSIADTLVFVEWDWVPGNNAQAAMRIQQVGKEALLQILFATLPGSIDEQVSAANMRKVRDSLQIFG